MPSAWRIARLLVLLCCALLLTSCSHRTPADTLVMIIESSPANLDPRIGTDDQSERIGKLLYDSLVRRDEHFDLQPSLAERWETPDPLTYIFHLRHGVRFHNGATLTSRDVKWTLDSLIQGKVVSAKSSTYKYIERVDTPDDHTVVLRLSAPYTSLLWNLSDGALGIVPYGSGAELAHAPNGTGPFKFVSEEQDSELIIERNDEYWGEKPHVKRVRFAVVPDITTRALELRKGSADIELNAITPDMIVALRQDPNLQVSITPGTVLMYLAFNLRDPILKDVRVRQAIAYAIDRPAMIHYLWRDAASPANSILPEQHWAYDPNVRKYEHDPERAKKILDDAGFRAVNGVRFHLTIKTSTEEMTRLLAAVLQQQLRQVGIALDIRTFEFATFYSDVVKGAFQMYSLRWLGDNEDPGIFEHVFHSNSFPPKRANRGFYVNHQVDAWLDAARVEPDEAKRKQLYFKVQEQLSEDLPYVDLWYLKMVAVYSKRLKNVNIPQSGNYDFLRTVELQE
jgi:peptide/nickel transport system substrate-binding protein